MQNRGIVICGGGRLLLCALVNIIILRRHDCQLPIELWHFPDEALPKLSEGDLKQWNVKLRTIPWQKSKYTSKPHAIVNSQFSEVMVLDADNTPIRNPEYLFDSKEYNESGALFWPDFKKATNKETWKVLANCEEEDTWQQESGQLVINKKRHREAINKTLEYNLDYPAIHPLLWKPGGDKDTYHLAWRYVRAPFTMIQVFPGSCGNMTGGKYLSNTMVQHDLNGDPLFMHKNAKKWHIIRKPEKCWDIMIHAKNPDGTDIRVKINDRHNPHTHQFLPEEETIQINARDVIGSLEDECHEIIHFLKARNWYRIAAWKFVMLDRLKQLVKLRKLVK